MCSVRSRARTRTTPCEVDTAIDRSGARAGVRGPPGNNDLGIGSNSGVDACDPPGCLLCDCGALLPISIGVFGFDGLPGYCGGFLADPCDVAGGACECGAPLCVAAGERFKRDGPFEFRRLASEVLGDRLTLECGMGRCDVGVPPFPLVC